MVLAVYSTLLLVVLIGGLPWWLLRMATSGRYRAGLLGRLGIIPPALRQSIARTEGGPLIWLHAVSVGEVLAATPLVHALEPCGFRFAVSTTTQAGQELARKRFPGAPVFYMPLDFAFTIRRYLKLLGPCLVITMESELWPRLIHECRARQIPLCVVNARISDRSFPRYMRLRPLWSPFLREVTRFFAQSDETVDRLIQMGVSKERAVLAGNLKYDMGVTPDSPIKTKVLSLLAGNRVVIAGSTLPGEEAALLAAWPEISAAVPNVQLLIAPRHTPRFDEVAALIRERGYEPLRLGTLKKFPTESPTPLKPSTILLLDTIGDLAGMYSIASVAFLGGSLVPKGGHNPLEPARFGVPVVMGESYENFREIVDGMRDQEAIRIVGQGDLAQVITTLLTHPEEASQLGARGQLLFRAKSGAAQSMLEPLVRIIRTCGLSSSAGSVLRSGEKDWSRPQRPALLPLVPLYRAALWVKDRMLARGLIEQRRLQGRVISVGSLSAGGAGKTPVVMLVAAMLRDAGNTVDILSRGYGRTGKGVEQVDPNGPAARYGDEPTLMARRLQLPVWVGSNRSAAGQAAEAIPAPPPRVHILDDGFQHRKLHRDLDLVLLTLQDIQTTLLPAGDLRETRHALRRADIVVVREEEASALATWIPHGKKIWEIRRTLTLPADNPSRPLVFCGIARPDDFFTTLKSLKVEPAALVPFNDHHAYGMRDITRLIASANAANANGFLTTEKDIVKLTPPMRRRLEAIGPVLASALQVTLVKGSLEDLTSKSGASCSF